MGVFWVAAVAVVAPPTLAWVQSGGLGGPSEGATQFNTATTGRGESSGGVDGDMVRRLLESIQSAAQIMKQLDSHTALAPQLSPGFLQRRPIESNGRVLTRPPPVQSAPLPADARPSSSKSSTVSISDHFAPPPLRRCTADDVSKVRGWILDCDGVLYNWKGLIPGVQSFFDWMEAAKTPFVLMSNTLKTREGVAKKFQREGTKIDQEIDAANVVTVGEALAEYMEDHVPPHSKIVAFGTHVDYKDGTVENIETVLAHKVPKDLLETWEIRKPQDFTYGDALEWANIAREGKTKVVIAIAFGDGFPQASYPELSYMSILLRNGASMAVAGPDLVDSHPRDIRFPNVDTTWPSLGGYEQFLLNSAEMFDGTVAKNSRHANVGKGGVLGKKYMVDKGMQILREKMPDIEDGQVMIVGDNLGTDILAGNISGIKSMLVLTGAHQKTSVADWPANPSCYLDSVASVPQLFTAAAAAA